MKKVPCPTCKTMSDWNGNAFRPFCSEHCSGKDLGNWATERYRVEAQDDEVGEQKPVKKDEE